MPFNTLQDLSGHSGCRVMLCEADGHRFIRKKSSHPSYNDRLKNQYLKQKQFELDLLKTPKIYDSGYEDGIFYFDMEYIPAKRMSEHIHCLEIEDIVRFLDLLCSRLPFGRGEKDKEAGVAFTRKISSLAESLPAGDEAALKAVDTLGEFDFSSVPRSYCCGDLTLENILITDNKNIYLIDFLDSFYNSWMIDVAKLFQDLEFKWSYRSAPKNINRELRLLIAREVLVKKIVDLEQGLANLFLIYHIVLLNTLRIIPYARDGHTRAYLDRTLTDVMARIGQIKEYM